MSDPSNPRINECFKRKGFGIIRVYHVNGKFVNWQMVDDEGNRKGGGNSSLAAWRKLVATNVIVPIKESYD